MGGMLTVLANMSVCGCEVWLHPLDDITRQLDIQNDKLVVLRVLLCFT